MCQSRRFTRLGNQIARRRKGIAEHIRDPFFVSKMVEAAGIEPASKGCDQRDLHVYFVHLNFAVREQMNKQDLTIS